MNATGTLRVTLTTTCRGEPLAVVDNLPGDGAELTPQRLRALAQALSRIASDCEARAAQRGKKLRCLAQEYSLDPAANPARP